MRGDLLGILVRAARRLARFRRRAFVLRATGEAVRLLGPGPDPAAGSCLVETADGAIRLVRPEELASRPGLVAEELLLQLALVLAASVATLALLDGR